MYFHICMMDADKPAPASGRIGRTFPAPFEDRATTGNWLV